MTLIRRTNPLGELISLRQAMDRLFGDSFVRPRGALSRTVTLPGGLRSEAATASFDNGLLTLTIPKAEEVKPRHIQITPTSAQSAADNGQRAEPGESTPAEQDN